MGKKHKKRKINKLFHLVLRRLCKISIRSIEKHTMIITPSTNHTFNLKQKAKTKQKPALQNLE